MKHKSYLFLFVFSFYFTIVFSQDYKSPKHLSTKDYISISFPPLDSLFENAKDGPIYSFAQAKEEIERKNLAKEKRAFLGFFSLRGSYQYGMFGNESTYTDITIAPFLSYSTQAQNGYTIGAGMNIPLDGLFDLKGRISRQKLALQSAQYEKEIKFDEIRREIIELYTKATSQINILRLRSEALELAKLQYEIAEKDFINGLITSSELSIDKQRQSTALENLENSRFELTRSVMILELISNTKIIK